MLRIPCRLAVSLANLSTKEELGSPGSPRKTKSNTTTSALSASLARVATAAGPASRQDSMRGSLDDSPTHKRITQVQAGGAGVHARAGG
jgi:hypothetical protein